MLDDNLQILILRSETNQDPKEFYFIDSLTKKSKTSAKVSKYPKWINHAEDLKRKLDNHKFHGLLFTPYIPTKDNPKSKDPLIKFVPVEHPLTFESIKQMLDLGLY